MNTKIKTEIALGIIIIIAIIIGGVFWLQDKEQNQNGPLMNVNDSSMDIEIGWIFEVAMAIDVNGADVPNANISVVVNGNKTEIGQYLGYPEEVVDGAGLNVSKDYILACKTWFGGAGTDIYIKKVDDKTLAVFQRDADESSAIPQDFKKIKEINFTKKIKFIKIIKPTQVNTDQAANNL